MCSFTRQVGVTPWFSRQGQAHIVSTAIVLPGSRTAIREVEATPWFRTSFSIDPQPVSISPTVNISIVFICTFFVDCGRIIRHPAIKNDSSAILRSGSVGFIDWLSTARFYLFCDSPPSCFIRPMTSFFTQLSTKRPSEIVTMVNPVISTVLPVGGMPKIGPWCVPRVVARAQTLSPSATSSSIVMSRSGKAVRNIVTMCLMASVPLGGVPGGASWTT